MGTMSVTLGTDANPLTRSKTVADSDFTSRIIPAFQRQYGASLTNAQLMDAFANDIYQYLKTIVRRHERAEAEASLPAVTELPLT